MQLMLAHDNLWLCAQFNKEKRDTCIQQVHGHLCCAVQIFM